MVSSNLYIFLDTMLWEVRKTQKKWYPATSGITRVFDWVYPSFFTRANFPLHARRRQRVRRVSRHFNHGPLPVRRQEEKKGRVYAPPVRQTIRWRPSPSRLAKAPPSPLDGRNEGMLSLWSKVACVRVCNPNMYVNANIKMMLNRTKFNTVLILYILVFVLQND